MPIHRYYWHKLPVPTKCLYKKDEQRNNYNSRVPNIYHVICLQYNLREKWSIITGMFTKKQIV